MNSIKWLLSLIAINIVGLILITIYSAYYSFGTMLFGVHTAGAVKDFWNTEYSLDSEIKNRHDALIRARHTYAHKGNKPNFDILQYIQGNVMFLEFLLKEIKLLKFHLFDRIGLQERFENILIEYNTLCKAHINVKTYQSSLSKLKKECIEFLKIYNSLGGLMNSYSNIYPNC